MERNKKASFLFEKETKDTVKIQKRILKNTYFRRAPPGRLGSIFIRFPAMSRLFKDLRASSAALIS